MRKAIGSLQFAVVFGSAGCGDLDPAQISVSPRWVAQISYPGVDFLHKIAIDPDGDVLVAGTIIENPVDDSNPDLFIAKYDRRDGAVMWSQRLATRPAEFLAGMVVDARGDAYLVAQANYVEGPVAYGAFTLTTDTPGDIVALRISGRTGEVLWAQRWGGAGADLPAAVALDGDELFVAGSTAGDAAFGDHTIAAGDGSDFVAVASTLDGSVSRVRSLPTVGFVYGMAVSRGAVALTGTNSAPAVIDGACQLSPGSSNDHAMILDLAGDSLACRWAHSFGDDQPHRNAGLYAVTGFPGGGWLAVGGFSGTMAVAPGEAQLVSPVSGVDALAVRFAAEGTPLWASGYVSGGAAAAVAVAADGDLVIGGTLYGTMSFGPIAVTGSGNAFVARMSGDGDSVRWARELGGGGGAGSADLLNGIAVAPDGSIYLVSDFHGQTDVGGVLMTAAEYDAWVLALSPGARP